MNHNAGIFAAAVGISAMVTAGFGWLPVLIGWCIGAVILLLLPECREGNMGRISAAVILLGGILVLAVAALGAEDAFPEDTTFPFVSVSMLALTWRSLCGDKDTGSRVANLLGLVLLPMVGAVLLFGLKDVRWGENLPAVRSWWQIPVTVAVTTPWWCLRSGEMEKKSWFWYTAAGAFGVGMSLLTQGILGSGLVAAEEFTLYRAVQTIRILGVLQRMEALLAAAILMGAFCVMVLVGRQMGEALDVLLPEIKRPWKVVWTLVAAFAVECSLRMTKFGEEGVLETVFWGIILLLALWIVFSRKIEKTTENP